MNFIMDKPVIEASVKIIYAGILSTIQDQGRFGLRKFGVPLSGAMDLYSAQFANALLNNDAHCAVLESTIIGPTLTFNSSTYIVVTGAKCQLSINKNNANLNTVIKINSGDTLHIGKITNGVRTYIAVSGGWQTPLILNSRSYYAGITKDKLIQIDDEFKISPPCKEIITRATVKFDSCHLNNNLIQVDRGPEFDQLDSRIRQTLLNRSFKVSPQSNRMAYKLENDYNLKAKEIITSSVQPGTVQMTPSGELIILMRDCQTTGGYARVLQLTDFAINQLSQKPAGSNFKFSIK